MVNWLKRLYAERWEYGTCRDKPARRHRFKGNVQFVLHKAGTHGYFEDYWHDFHSYWWNKFRPQNESTGDHDAS